MWMWMKWEQLCWSFYELYFSKYPFIEIESDLRFNMSGPLLLRFWFVTSLWLLVFLLLFSSSPTVDCESTLAAIRKSLLASELLCVLLLYASILSNSICWWWSLVSLQSFTKISCLKYSIISVMLQSENENQKVFKKSKEYKQQNNQKVVWTFWNLSKNYRHIGNKFDFAWCDNGVVDHLYWKIMCTIQVIARLVSPDNCDDPLGKFLKVKFKWSADFLHANNLLQNQIISARLN